MERRFKRSLVSLDKIFAFTDSFCASESIAESEAFALNFVIEELFTNMIKYQPEGEQDVLLTIARDGSSLVVRMEDSDVEYFDITRIADADVDKPLHERTPGGLGIFLIRKIVDRIEYAYSGRRSVVTLVKHLRE